MLRREPVQLSWIRIQGEREVTDGAESLKRQKGVEPESRVSLSHGKDISSTSET